MRRVYKEAHAGSCAGAHQVLLDGKPLRTPARAPLDLPTRALAEAIAAEWQAQAETVWPSTMPLTPLAATAIDHQICHPETGQPVFGATALSPAAAGDWHSYPNRRLAMPCSTRAGERQAHSAASA